MRQQILDEIDRGVLTSTGMSERASLPPKEQAVAAFRHLPKVAEYVDKIYGTNDLTGWEASAELTAKIYQHYDSFLRMVPDQPKIIIKRIISEKDTFWTHCGKAQLSSLTCVIRTDSLAVTQWYEPKPEFAAKYRAGDSVKYNNRLGSNLFPDHSQFVTSICLQPWEMIFFDHNSYHSVEKFQPNMERILFSIGFLNTTETELEDIYDRWYLQHVKS
jgi:hypothetical protein